MSTNEPTTTDAETWATRTGTGTNYGVVREDMADACSLASCPAIATETGRVHTFTATDDFRASFDGWVCSAGDCAACDGATGPCTFTVSRDSALTAQREPTQAPREKRTGGVHAGSPGRRAGGRTALA